MFKPCTVQAVRWYYFTRLAAPEKQQKHAVEEGRSSPPKLWVPEVHSYMQLRARRQYCYRHAISAEADIVT